MTATLKSRIPLIIGELDDKLLEAVQELAQRISEGAQDRVPVATGRLRSAIHVETDGERVAVVAGDSETFYGHIVENGGVNHAPHPFLVPAFEAERENLRDVVGEKLRDL